MKIVQTWTQNGPSSAGGYSVTIKYIYSSYNKSEIDDVIKKLPKGMIVMDTDKTERMYPLKEIKI